MPPKKAAAAQKGKARMGETIQAQRATRARVYDLPEDVPQSEGSATPPLVQPGVGPSAAPEVRVPAPETPAPQPGAEDRTLREAV